MKEQENFFDRVPENGGQDYVVRFTNLLLDTMKNNPFLNQQLNEIQNSGNIHGFGLRSGTNEDFVHDFWTLDRFYRLDAQVVDGALNYNLDYRTYGGWFESLDIDDIAVYFGTPTNPFSYINRLGETESFNGEPAEKTIRKAESLIRRFGKVLKTDEFTYRRNEF